MSRASDDYAPIPPRKAAPVELIDRMPPHDIGSEMALLGSMIIDPMVIDPVLMLVPTADFFYKEEHGVMFTVVVDLYRKGHPIDALLVHSTLNTLGKLESAGGYEYLKEILGTVPSAAHAEYYASIVREKHMLRRTISACTQTLKDAYESGDAASLVIQHGQERLGAIESVQADGSSVTMNESLGELMADLDRGRRGLPSGLVELDQLTAGFNPGDVIVVGARTSVGKTSFGVGVAEHLAVHEKIPVAIFSLEMSHTQLSLRALCGNAGVDSHKFKTGALGIEDKSRIRAAVGELSNAPIFIEDGRSLSALKFRKRARDMVLKNGVKLIVLDYLQLMTVSGGWKNREQQIAELSRGIKLVAMELGVPIIVICQLNRSSETENRIPKISDLRESGAIENDADLIILLHSEEVSNRGNQAWINANPDKLGITLAILAKHRNGPCGIVTLTYLKSHTRFVNYTAGT